MSRLRAIVRPQLVAGFNLAGVEAFGAEDAEAAAALLNEWLDQGDECLVAVDDVLAQALDPALLTRIASVDRLLYLAIPGGGVSDYAATRSARIARMIRRSIGVRFTFGNDKERSET